MENKNENVKTVVSSLKNKTTKTSVKKTPKKKLVVKWPETPFSIQSLQKKYKDVVNITLRFRINQAKEKAQIVEIGKEIQNMGRPTLLFCTLPVTKEKLSSLSYDLIELHPQYKNIKDGIESVEVATFNSDVKTVKIEPSFVKEQVKV